MTVICPYCGLMALLVSGNAIYPLREDLADRKFFLCQPCDAYVGCHKDGRPLGSLANAQLRAARSRAHKEFDPLWKKNVMSRTEAYLWLADILGIEPKDCHIGMFDEHMCEKVIKVVIHKKGAK